MNVGVGELFAGHPLATLGTPLWGLGGHGGSVLKAFFLFRPLLFGPLRGLSQRGRQRVSLRASFISPAEVSEVSPGPPSTQLGVGAVRGGMLCHRPGRHNDRAFQRRDPAPKAGFLEEETLDWRDGAFIR